MAVPSAYSAEWDLSWSGDFSLDDTGDIIVAQDSASVATATVERLTRLLLTNPIVKNSSGLPIATPDDLFHPNWGAGLRAAVDGVFSQANIAALTALIRDQLAQDPGVATTPAPLVSLTMLDYQTMQVQVTISTVSGQVVPLPTLYISPQGA